MEGWKIGRMEDWGMEGWKIERKPQPTLSVFLAFHTALKIY